MNPHRLAEMVNDIAAYFQAEPDRGAALEDMVLHLQRFWEPRMREQIVRHLQSGGDHGLVPLAREAVAELATRSGRLPTPPQPEGGGDAG